MRIVRCAQKGRPRPLSTMLEKRDRGKRKAPGDSLCSRNARLQKALVERAHDGENARPLLTIC